VLWVFVTPKGFGINQKSELVIRAIQDCFGESHTVVAERANSFCYGLFDSVPGKLIGHVRGDC
jgi:hypothetical protein